MNTRPIHSHSCSATKTTGGSITLRKDIGARNAREQSRTNGYYAPQELSEVLVSELIVAIAPSAMEISAMHGSVSSILRGPASARAARQYANTIMNPMEQTDIPARAADKPRTTTGPDTGAPTVSCRSRNADAGFAVIPSRIRPLVLLAGVRIAMSDASIRLCPTAQWSNVRSAE